MNEKNNSDFEDGIDIIDDDKDIFDINTFIKLIIVTPDFNNFENHKTLFLHGFHLFSKQKKRHI